MIDQPISISKVYLLINKVLNTLIRRKFGNQYSIRLNSLRFISNRTNTFYFHNCCEKIILKSNKPVTIDELNNIHDYLVFQVNSALKCIDSNSYQNVTKIEILIS
jgi:hypothetical protein